MWKFSVVTVGVANLGDQASLLQSRSKLTQARRHHQVKDHQRLWDSGFAIDHLGPFHLSEDVDRGSIQVDPAESTWEHDGVSGKLADTRELDADGTKYWGGHTIAWAYPDQPRNRDLAPGSWDRTGGFVLTGEGGQTVYTLTSQEERPDKIMYFSEPFAIDHKEWKNLCSSQRSPITLGILKDLGAKEYCWAVNSDQCERGCFLYRTRQRHSRNRYQGFSVTAQKFSIESLGPFHLVPAADDTEVQINAEERTWTSGQNMGHLAHSGTTLGLSEEIFWQGATTVDWAYPADISSADHGTLARTGAFLLLGGSDPVTVLELDLAGAEVPLATLHFSAPFAVEATEWQLHCSSLNNEAPITLDVLLAVGAENFCWAVYGDEHGHPCGKGCFLYETTTGYQGFAVTNLVNTPDGDDHLHDHVPVQFAIANLGPFHLFENSSIQVNLNTIDNTWEQNGAEGKLGHTRELDADGAKYWEGESATYTKIDWAYQAYQSALGDWERYGGFVLTGEGVQTVYTIGAGSSPDKIMHFSEPFEIEENDWENLCSTHSTPITLGILRDVGAEEYCWAVNADQCERGCFLYKTERGYQGFSVTNEEFALLSLGPFHLVRAPADNGMVLINPEARTWTRGDMTGHLAHEESTLDITAKNFWQAAVKVDWAYPADGSDYDHGTLARTGAFLLLGGNDVVQNELLIDLEGADVPVLSLQFGAPFVVDAKQWQSKCSDLNNEAPITLEVLWAAGARNFCWTVHEDGCGKGCFFYETTFGFQGFAVQNNIEGPVR